MIVPTSNLFLSVYLTCCMCVFLCRQEKDVPVLYSAEIEERQISERLEKMQSYRLVRENILERRKQQEINRKKLMERQVDMYDKMQVSHVCGKSTHRLSQAILEEVILANLLPFYTICIPSLCITVSSVFNDCMKSHL